MNRRNGQHIDSCGDAEAKATSRHHSLRFDNVVACHYLNLRYKVEALPARHGTLDHDRAVNRTSMASTSSHCNENSQTRDHDESSHALLTLQTGSEFRLHAEWGRGR